MGVTEDGQDSRHGSFNPNGYESVHSNDDGQRRSALVQFADNVVSYQPESYGDLGVVQMKSGASVRSGVSQERAEPASPGGTPMSPKSIRRQKSKKGILLELLDDDETAAKAIRQTRRKSAISATRKTDADNTSEKSGGSKNALSKAK
jgi:hypothetical protein